MAAWRGKERRRAKPCRYSFKMQAIYFEKLRRLRASVLKTSKTSAACIAQLSCLLPTERCAPALDLTLMRDELPSPALSIKVDVVHVQRHFFCSAISPSLFSRSALLPRRAQSPVQRHHGDAIHSHSSSSTHVIFLLLIGKGSSQPGRS